ncbi:MAG: iron-sulfur cluster carrier protein ApbC [Colwellia sp.]|nr:iron-sulfur cluster carrier protein ApbC [Colwellia sp.]
MFKKLFSRKTQTAKNEELKTALGPNSQLSSDDNEQESIIVEALKNYQSTSFPQGILSCCTDLKIKIAKDEIIIGLTTPFPCKGELSILAQSLTKVLTTDVSFNLHLAIVQVRDHQINNVKNIIAIASGKGGVGKSTTAVNLAYALIEEGAKVGILDADIYGPSIPTMLGIKNQKPSSIDGKFMTPLIAHNLYAMSIGFLVAEEDATVWRGPMASSAFSQLLNETAWPDLDYLLIDMPPGTGDIQLTLAQKVPVAAAVVITTPQDIALADAVKGIAMFEKVQVPVLGIIENMSYHQCENCGHLSHLFGEGGGADIAAQYQTQLLGQLPLAMNIRQDADFGKSSVIENSTSEIALLYRSIARNVAAQLFWQLDNRSPQNAEVCFIDKKPNNSSEQ